MLVDYATSRHQFTWDGYSLLTMPIQLMWLHQDMVKPRLEAIQDRNLFFLYSSESRHPPKIRRVNLTLLPIKR